MPASPPPAQLCATLLLSLFAAAPLVRALEPEPLPAAIIESSSLDLFGAAVAGDSDTLFVSAPFANAWSGTVHLYYRGPAGFRDWRKHGELRPTYPTPLRMFGHTLAYTQNLVAVSAHDGPVFIFERVPFSGDYQQTAVIELPEDTEFQHNSMSMSGGMLAIGVNIDGTPGAGEAGSVRLYARQPTGTWEYRGKVQAQDPTEGALFGSSVALIGDYHLVVGAPGTSAQAGSVYIFQGVVGGTLIQRQKLVSPEPRPDGWFGHSVATNGAQIVVGEPGDGLTGDAPGRAFLFDWVAPFDSPNFTFTQELTPTDPPPARGRFGLAVGIDGNNRDVVVTQLPDDPGLNHQRPGAASVFTFGVHGWQQRFQLAPTASEFPDAFGASLAVASIHAVVGDYGTDQKPGAVYVYDLTLPEIPPVFTAAPGDTQIDAPPGQSAAVTFEASVADENGEDLDVIWEVDGVQIESDFVDGSVPFTRGDVDCTVTLTPGAHLIRLRAVERHHGIETQHTFTATVGDFAGPIIHRLTANPSQIRAQLGRLVPIRIGIDVTDPSGPVRWRITHVTSSDPVGRRPDWIVPGHGHGLLVRAETTQPRRDRVYTIEVTATDVAGNNTTAETTVTVVAGLKKKR